MTKSFESKIDDLKLEAKTATISRQEIIKLQIRALQLGIEKRDKRLRGGQKVFF